MKKCRLRQKKQEKGQNLQSEREGSGGIIVYILFWLDLL